MSVCSRSRGGASSSPACHTAALSPAPLPTAPPACLPPCLPRLDSTRLFNPAADGEAAPDLTRLGLRFEVWAKKEGPDAVLSFMQTIQAADLAALLAAAAGDRAGGGGAGRAAAAAAAVGAAPGGGGPGGSGQRAAAVQQETVPLGYLWKGALLLGVAGRSGVGCRQVGTAVSAGPAATAVRCLESRIPCSDCGGTHKVAPAARQQYRQYPRMLLHRL